MSFLFPLGDIVPPAAANALFPEQTSVPFAAAAGQNGSAIFPELLTALSEAEAGPPSLDATDGLSPAGSPTAPVFTRPVVWAGRQERLGRLAKANDEECDAAACAARYIFPWAGTSQETMTGFGLSLSLPLPSSDLEHGEAAVSQDSDLHDSQLVMHAGFLPTEPLVEKPPVSADAFVEVRQVGEALLERDEPQLSSGVNTLPAAESEIAIPLWAKTEKTAAEEPSPELPRQENIVSFATLSGAAMADRTEGAAPSHSSASSSFVGAPAPVDTRRQVPDGRQLDPATSKVPFSETAEPVAREAFRLLLREKTALPVESRAEAAARSTPPVSGPPIPVGSFENAEEGEVRLPPITAPLESPVKVRSAGDRTPIRAHQPFPDEVPRFTTSTSLAKPAVSQAAEVTREGIQISAGLPQGGSAHNGDARHREQSNGVGERLEASAKPVLSREHPPLLFDARPTAGSFNGKPVSELAAPVRPLEKPVGASAVPNPVRQLRVSLPSFEAGGGVQLLVQQKPGGVEVSVHSPNQSVRETLRSGLSELIGSLDRKGVITEILPSISALAGGLAERLDSTSPTTTTEVPEREGREDSHGRQGRQPHWESGGDNRRRQNPDADAWRKYLEEYTWRNQ